MDFVQCFMSDISTKRHSPSRLRRLLTLFSLGVLALVFALTAGVLYLNWRGHREWEQFKSEWEAKGEKFTVADFIPAAVPEDQNFAAAPMFAGLLDFTKVPGQPVRWNNSRARDRASAMGAILQNKGSRKAPPTGQWQAGAFVDLVQWQQFLLLL